VNVTKLAIPDLLLIAAKRFDDDRGFFSEVFNARTFAQAGLDHDWVQDNHALSHDRATLRGLHFQSPPHAQAKLIRVTRGAIFDVAVDIRSGSPSFGKWASVILSAKAWNQLLVPRGFAHGYLTLEADTEVLYKVDAYYARESDAGIVWSDPQLAIDWPLDGSPPILSAKDQALPRLSEIVSPFTYKCLTP